MSKYVMTFYSLILAISINTNPCESYKTEINFLNGALESIASEIKGLKERKEDTTFQSNYLKNLEKRIEELKSKNNNCKNELSN